jgi:hypothetical protein
MALEGNNYKLVKKRATKTFGGAVMEQGTYSKNTNAMNVTLQDMQKWVEWFDEHPVINNVVYFMYVVDNQIFHGEHVDEILGCKKNEKGFLIPINLRDRLREIDFEYREVTAKDLYKIPKVEEVLW